MKTWIGCTGLGLAAAVALAAPFLWAQTAPPPEVITQSDVLVPMRDGVKLATNVYLPGHSGVVDAGKFPVILTRTPYNKDSAAAAARFYVPRGYAVVSQDVRGRYHSEGHWFPLCDDPNDGFDTATWIGQQPWFAGAIGTIGTSYEGGTQHALAIADAPYLKAMVPRCAMSDIGLYGVRHNGAFELRFFNWVFMMGDPNGTRLLPIAAARAASDPAAVPALVDLSKHVQDYVSALPLHPGTTALQFAPDYEAWLVEAMRHGDDDAFWKNSGVSVVDHLAEYEDVPEYMTTGWYDSWGGPVANLNFVDLKKTKKSPQHIIIGPWTHSAESRTYAGEAQFTNDAALNLNQLQLRWFDRWLKGIDNGIDREAPVRIYVMGGGDAHKTPQGRVFVGGHWRDEPDWPLARARATGYYLHPRGLLSTAVPGDDAPLRYQFDPKHPVPTLGGNISSQGALALAGAVDQRCRHDFWLCTDDKPLATRSDVLVFQTPPLSADTEVTGRLLVDLWAASSAVDTDFTAKLIDVYPPSADFPAGVALNVGDSIVRARYRNGSSAAVMMTPGKPYPFHIEMYPTSLVFQKGHRIRLDISSSNFPRFDVNPNTGEPLNDNRSWATAINTVYLDAKHPSRITLPIVP